LQSAIENKGYIKKGLIDSQNTNSKLHLERILRSKNYEN
jgi:hypothetical protein